MENEEKKKPVSPEKLAANRANAQRSTGPRTTAGKQRSAQNPWEHGGYAARLFPPGEPLEVDWKDYKLILDGVRMHYEPVGFMESFWADKIAAEMFRTGRAIGQGTKLSSGVDWANVRVEAHINRELTKAIGQLERLQEARKEKLKQDPTSGGAADNPQRPANDGSPSGNCETNPAVSCETTNPIGITPPPIANCGTNPTFVGEEDQPKDNRPVPLGLDGLPKLTNGRGPVLLN